MKYILTACILISNLLSLESGYYIYKFSIDKSNNITIEDSNYINQKLKESKVKKHIHNPLSYQIKNEENSILKEGYIQNPKIIYFEDLLLDKPIKHSTLLDSAYFVLKIPAYKDLDYVEFYKSKEKSDTHKIKLPKNNHTRIREVFPVSDILINGSNDSRVNIVFLGDGYKQNQMDSYISDVEDVVDELFNTIPYSNYKNYFNVYAVEVR